MNSFNNQLHSDEFAHNEPTADDWAEYHAYLSGELEQAELDAANAELQQIAAAEQGTDEAAPELTHDENGEYIWSDEAIEWEEGFHPDNLYDDEDDGQPSEYDEWQDYMGGDDWDHGQYDGMDYDFDMYSEW